MLTRRRFLQGIGVLGLMGAVSLISPATAEGAKRRVRQGVYSNTYADVY